MSGFADLSIALHSGLHFKCMNSDSEGEMRRYSADVRYLSYHAVQIVVNALMYAIPSIFNVLLVCLVFWLIFSIMGVQFFGGKFYKCLNEDNLRLPVTVVKDKWECADKNYSWVNSKITFDHVGHAYLALFQVVSA